MQQQEAHTKPTVIVTGASRGIGHYLLDEFAQQGNEVIGVYNSTEPKLNLDRCYQLDITNREAVTNFVQEVGESLRNVVLVNAAGISYNALGHKAKIEQWNRVLDTNLVALFHLTSLLLPIMRENNYGRIINFSSVVAQAGVVGTSAYAASKAGLWGLGKALAIENASKNITINNINLGYFDIGMIEQVPAPILENIINKIPANRLGNPSEIWNTVNYIVNTPYLNGASIDLNGGLF